ncbi:MAG TPA: GTP cyclohydrolase II [Micropepsaceae bacterium]|nr:GTP cyclohydrolase II [Micropepsaceae bacterium]
MTQPLFSAVEEAALVLRRGLPVCLTDGSNALLALSAETLTPDRLSAMKPERAVILITHPRAATLKIRLYTEGAIAIPFPAERGFELVRHLADPISDLSHPLMGPFHALRDGVGTLHVAAIKLAKLAGLLPCVVARPATPEERKACPAAAASDVLSYDDAQARAFRAVASARVPLKGAEETQVVAFRASNGGPEHLALLIGNPVPPGPVLVRLHSECFTGDLLGSLKCDCGDQLRGAIEAIAKGGGGVLLYLAQEGRGIGLMNKLRAYALQDQGFDTVEANLRLGFGEDERVFRPAVTMLTALGFTRIRLLTNNPEKVDALKRMGLEMVERVPHAFPANPHNAHYLATKRKKAGHDI